MNNIQKYVMVPFDKYEKLKQQASFAKQSSFQEQQDVNNLKELSNQEGQGESTVAPPPGIPEKKVVRWLPLPNIK
jgi:hypothetical protein